MLKDCNRTILLYRIISIDLFSKTSVWKTVFVAHTETFYVSKYHKMRKNIEL